MESKRISHCDTTPDAFIVLPDTGEIKLTDFGYIKKARLTEDFTALTLERSKDPEQQ